MNNENHIKDPVKVVFYDTGLSFGGTLTLLKMIFDEIDRSKVTPRLISSLPKDVLCEHFRNEDISHIDQRPLNYSHAERWKLWAKKRLLMPQRLSAYVFTIASILSNMLPFFKLMIALIKEKPQVVHTNNGSEILCPARLLNLPVVWHVHGDPGKMSFVERFYSQQVRHYVAISKYIESCCHRAGYPKERTITLLNPAPKPDTDLPDKKTLRDQFDITPEQKVLVHVGRLVPWKGQLEFLKAVRRLVQDNANIVAWILGADDEFGSPYQIQLKQFIVENGLKDHARMFGHVPNPSPYIKAADVLVHTSLEPEPFGLVITEAMRLGTRVLAANQGAPIEIIGDNERGILINPKDTEMLATNISSLLKQDSLAMTIQENCSDWLTENACLRRYTRRLEDIYLQT